MGDGSAAQPSPAEGPPRVSIGIPVCNGQNYLSTALTSLLSQTFQSVEYIISDNASDDDTPRICREFADADPRVRFSRSPQRLTLAQNWNRVLALSRGTYFMWAAHDDVWEPDYVQRLVDLLEHDPAALFALARFDMIDGTGNLLFPEPCRFDDFCSSSLYRRLLAFLASEFPGKGNAVHGLMRREALEWVDGASSFDQLLIPGDWLLIFRLLTRGRFVYDDALLFHKRDGYVKSSAPGSVIQSLGRTYTEFSDYSRYARIIETEVLRMDELSESQKSDLVRVAHMQVRLLYKQKALVLLRASGRRLRRVVAAVPVKRLPSDRSRPSGPPCD